MEENNNVENTPVVEQKPKKKGTIIIIVLLALIALGVGGYFCYDKFIAKKPDASNKEKETEAKDLDEDKDDDEYQSKDGEGDPKEYSGKDSEEVNGKLLTGKKLEDFKYLETNEEEHPCAGPSYQKEGFQLIDETCSGLGTYYLFTKSGDNIVNDLLESYIELYKSNAYIYVNDTIYKVDNSAKILFKEAKSNVQQIIDNYAIILDNHKLSMYNIDTQKTIDLGEVDSKYEYSVIPSGYYDKTTFGGNDVYKPGYYLVLEDYKTPYEELEKDSDGNELNAIEYYYIPETGETGKIKTFVGGYAKPILYLYPEKDNTKVQVTFAYPELLTITYPKFNKAWSVTANKNGDLHDSNGKYYYGLYWEESGSTKVDFSKGFYVTKDNAISFLEEKLTKIGLNDKERNEFIMYWLPILEKNGKNLVYFELTEERESYNKLKITPKPDSLLRLAIHVKKVNKRTNIKEQQLPTFKRSGFTAVEWGGVIH